MESETFYISLTAHVIPKSHSHLQGDQGFPSEIQVVPEQLVVQTSYHWQCCLLHLYSQETIGSADYLIGVPSNNESSYIVLRVLQENQHHDYVPVKVQIRQELNIKGNRSFRQQYLKAKLHLLASSQLNEWLMLQVISCIYSSKQSYQDKLLCLLSYMHPIRLAILHQYRKKHGSNNLTSFNNIFWSAVTTGVEANNLNVHRYVICIPELKLETYVYLGPPRPQTNRDPIGNKNQLLDMAWELISNISCCSSRVFLSETNYKCRIDSL